MARLIESKLANALIPKAKPGIFAKLIFNAIGIKLATDGLTAAGKLMGGLWVGGTAGLHEEEFTFHPNSMNRALHDDDCTVKIPLRDILEIKVRSGFVTNIIDITTSVRTLSIRCYGAEAFAHRIRNQVARCSLPLPTT